MDLVHQRLELVEQVVAIVRTCGGLGVILHAERGDLFVPYSGDGVVVEIAMGDVQALG